MANNALLTPSIITKESLVILSNNLVAANKFSRKFENSFVKIGATLTVRKPNRYVVNQGPGLVLQNTVEPYTSITVTNQSQVAIEFSTQDLTLTVDEFSERYLKPAMEELANAVDYSCLANFSNVFNSAGSAGTVPNGSAALFQTALVMDRFAVPQDNRWCILGPDAYWGIVAGLTTLFVQSVSEPALKGFLANIANFQIYLDQNVQAQIYGNYSGTGVVNGAGQTGSSLVTNGWTASTTRLFNAGDVFTIAGVFSVNPKNRASTGQLQQFVVTANVNSDANGNATIPISPAIVTSGAYANVTTAPANSARISPFGSAATSYIQNLAFVSDAFGLVMCNLDIPNGVDFAAQAKFKNTNIRIIRAYDINNDIIPCRLDILYGTATFYPELAVRLTN